MFSECALCRPASLDAAVDSIPRKVESFAPFRKTRGLPSKREHHISACISLLLAAGCPAAIFWCVVSVVVFSFNARAGIWAQPHVAEKVFEFSPTHTDANSSASVLCKIFGVAIGAPFVHAMPDLVLGRFAHAVCFRSVRMSTQFSSEAPAAFCFTPSNHLRSDNAGFAAVAFAFPKQVDACFACSFDHSETSEFLASEFDKVAGYESFGRRHHRGVA